MKPLGLRKADDAAIVEAARLIAAGAAVAFPTETVYGLGADARSGEAVARIYAAKARPRFNPLIVHVSSADAAEHFANLSAAAKRLAALFWPGPLTLVLALKPSGPISSLVTAGLDTVAIRVPDHSVAQRLLAASGCPIAAPSANRSGYVSATSAAHVMDDFGENIAMILDAGPTRHGIESTILDITHSQCRLLRPGAVAVGDIEAALGASLAKADDSGDHPASPGRLPSHYAPRANLRLNAQDVRPGEALLAFGPGAPPSLRTVNLSATGNLVEAASNLFAALRELDSADITRIAVMPIPDHGLGDALNDRLARAAAGRSS